MVEPISVASQARVLAIKTIPEATTQSTRIQSGPTIETPLEDASSVMPSGRAKVNVDFDELQASSDLHLRITDSNGLNRQANGDISGTLDGYVDINQSVLAKTLSGLVGTSSGDAKITGARFDSKNKSYVLSLKANVVWFVHDDLELNIKTDTKGRLYIQVSDNWVPDGFVIDDVRSAIQNMLKSKINQQQEIVSLKLETKREGDKLYLTPVLESVKVPLNKTDSIDIKGLNTPQAGRFELDAQGNLNLNFNNFHFAGSSNSNRPKDLSIAQADSAQMHIISQVFNDNSTEVSINGQIQLDLDAKDVQDISFGGEGLGKRISSAKMTAEIDTDLSISADKKVKALSHNHWKIDDAKIEGRKYDISAERIDVSLDTQDGLQLDIKIPQSSKATFKPELSQNIVEPIIGGPQYFDEMMKAIAGARESIEQETFLMYAGDKTTVIMRALALKAAGLREVNGKLQPDPLAKNGIPVHVLFNNNKLNHAGALPTIQQFEKVKADLDSEIQKSSLPAKHKQASQQQLQSHLKWGSLERGAAKADHRKLLIIDGKTGYTGGINMGNHFLQQDSYHDIMLKVNGPEVRKMQDAFITNWYDFTEQSPQSSDQWNQKSVKELDAHRTNYGKEHKLKATAAQVVTTDEKSTQIEAAYLHAINQATDKIHVEQAYYFYPPVQAALKQALARGVSIHMIVPNRSDEDLFDIINLEQIRDLMATQKQLGKGQVRAWVYTGDEGKYAHTVHTKALSADGKMAIVGSANLLPRSLRSPFQAENSDGIKSQILFNEEMSMYLEGPQVQQLDQKLFEKDKNKAIELDYEGIVERIDMLGGTKELQRALLKAQVT